MVNEYAKCHFKNGSPSFCKQGEQKKHFWNIFEYSQLASQSSLHFLQNKNLVLDVEKLQKMSEKVDY